MTRRKRDVPPSGRPGPKPTRRSREIPGLPDVHTGSGSLADAMSTGREEIIGTLESIANKTAEGWAMNVRNPAEPLIVEFFDGEHPIGSAIAFMFRSDLLAAGIGTGNHYFSFALPESVFDGKVHVISARFAGTSQNLTNSPTYIGQSAAGDAIKRPAKSKSHPIAFGKLEIVSDEGWVKGWAWYPERPQLRVEIEILVDSVVVGETIADVHRADLVAAGIGDGNYSFGFALPYDILKIPKDSMVSVRDKRASRVLAAPRLLQRREIVHAVEKLSELENDARLLHSTVALVADRGAADERAVTELFRTVGDFFVQLANATASGKAPGTLRTLRGAIEDMTARFAPVELPAVANPEISICIEATGPIEALYSTLRRIASSSSAIGTEVLLYDPGVCDEASLLPLVVRNLRYIYLGEQDSSNSPRNQVADLARGEVLIFLAGTAEPAENFLDAVYAAFRADASVAMVGAKIVRADGVLASAGVTVADSRSEPAGLGADPAAEAFRHPRRIDAVSGDAFAVRREAWQHSRGLDDGLASGDLALADLCLRVSAANGKIFFEPGFEVLLRQ